jgi:hydroxymethylpyrimidine pyrophosphatase-like HAD family hydrolase
MTPVFEISPIGAKKNVALSYLSRFYHVKNKNTIAIGDG